MLQFLNFVIMRAAMAIFTLFHSHNSTGNGGSTMVPSRCT